MQQRDEQSAMQVVYDSEHFIVVDKPVKWLTVPSRMGANDERPCLGTALERQLGVRLWPVHRLDFEVSGLVLFAKTPQAHKSANAWFESHVVHKTYEALSEGSIDDTHQPERVIEWRSHLLRGKRRSYESPHGKLAITRATCLGNHAQSSSLVWHLEPITGRPHQLRVHLSQHGFPIVGDTLYGSTRTWAPGGIALRAVQLDFTDCQEASRYGMPAFINVAGFAQAVQSKSMRVRKEPL